MPIDFSQVKTITIPEGSVTKITDSTGNTLWQGVGWHTIWEGNKTCSIKLNNNSPSVIIGNEANFAHTVSGTGYTPKIRVTFSYSISSHNSDFKDRFNINDTNYDLPNTITSSPVTIDELYDNNKNSEYSILGPFVRHIRSLNDALAVLRKKRDVENNRVNFSLKAFDDGIEGGNYGAYFTVSFTITKIEQYY